MLQTRMSRWLAGTVLVCVALLAGSYVLLIGPSRSRDAALGDDLSSAQDRTDTLGIQLAQLRAESAQLPGRRAELAAIVAQLPPTASVPTLLNQLDAAAKASGVTLVSVTPGASTYLTGTVGTAGTAAGPGSGGVLGQVVQIPLSLTSHGDYFAQLAFVHQLQHADRALLVSGLQFASAGSAAGASAAAGGGATGAGEVDLTLTGSVFALPGAGQAATGTAGTGTSATGSGSSTGGGTPASGATISSLGPQAGPGAGQD